MQLKFDVIGGDLYQGDFTVDLKNLSFLLGAFFESRSLGGYEEISVSLSLVDACEMEKLNRQYRNIGEPTDVLSFPLWEEDGKFLPPDGWTALPLGDVVVCPPYVCENAKKQEVDYNSEIVLMVVHGILHLIGYDHDTEERKDEMWRQQEALVREYHHL